MLFSTQLNRENKETPNDASFFGKVSTTASQKPPLPLRPLPLPPQVSDKIGSENHPRGGVLSLKFIPLVCVISEIHPGGCVISEIHPGG